jgi:hypothetical protein
MGSLASIKLSNLYLSARGEAFEEGRPPWGPAPWLTHVIFATSDPKAIEWGFTSPIKFIFCTYETNVAAAAS